MSLKSTSFMEEYSVAELLDKFNFYVPEIQREYVWGRNERNILSSFCEDIKIGKNQAPNDTLLQQKISKLTAEKKFNEIGRLLEETENGSPINIGFLYSYEPNYKMDHFPDSDVYKDTYIIDGQQRFTSLFLILFYLSVKEGRHSDFMQLFRYNNEISSIALDYRVRTVTHDFVIKLLKEIKKESDFSHINNSTWFQDAYNQDVTIKSMVNGLEIIQEKFKDQTDAYFDFIVNHILFWHFKTEKTNQGEELYITMNSRGKQLEGNETVRAKLFEQIGEVEQLKWSAEWENWQDFFWKNRNGKANADEGFNEFLKCIAGLESYLKGTKKFVSDSKLIYDDYLINNLSLEKIKLYFESLNFLLENAEEFKKSYKYAEWIDDCIEVFKTIVLDSKTNWFVDYEDPNKATERMRMVFIWSTLHFINSKTKSSAKPNINEVFRLLRIYWLRYNNHDRGVANAGERIEEALSKGLWYQCSTKEEELKHAFYLSQLKDEDDIKEFESRIWKIEDHRLNLNGYQVENINSIHLIDYTTLEDATSLEKIYKKFVVLFPENEVDYSTKINDILMFYGFYGMRRTPYYYFNYDFSSWRRIIRDLDSNKKAFYNFFNDFNGNSIEELYEIKKSNFLKKHKIKFSKIAQRIECEYLVDTICLYIILCENIWENGRYIAYEERYLDIDAITTFERKLDNQVPHKLMYNTKGTFRGYGYSKLYDFLPDNYLNNLKEYLDNIND